MFESVLDFIFVTPLVDFRLADSPFEVALVTDEHDDSFVCFGFADVVPLFLDILEGGLSGEVEDDEYSMTAFKVGGDDRSILFLSSSVPYVEFRWFFLESDVFDFEVDSGDLGFFFGEEVALGESPEEGGLSHVAVSHDYYFVTFFVLVVG